jgi:hypothetical protein
MITTNKKINLIQLDNELGNFGLCMDDNNLENKIIKTADNSPVTDDELNSAISAHIAKPEVEPTIDAKLAMVGLNLDDLKAALGI